LKLPHPHIPTIVDEEFPPMKMFIHRELLKESINHAKVHDELFEQLKKDSVQYTKKSYTNPIFPFLDNNDKHS